MKNAFGIFILGIFTICFTAYGSDESSSEEYIMGDVSTLSADFYLNVEVSTDGSAYENGANIVDRVCIFRVRQGDGKTASPSLYDISLFQDGTFSRMYPKQSLPFAMKRTYRGIADGDYRLTFVARDQTGKIGKGSVTVRVRH